MFVQIIINIVISASIFLLIANSFAISYYVTKFFNISHAAILTAGGYFTFFLFNQLSFNLWIAIPLSIVFSIIIGITTYFVAYKKLITRKTSNLLLLIASLGVYLILQNVISLIWGDSTKSLRINDVKPGFDFLGANITYIQIITVIASLFLFITILFFLKYNKIGRNIRAVAANSEFARIMGINSNKITLWSFTIGYGLAAISGILVGFDIGLTPTMGFNLLLYGVVSMIIGGIGSSWGLIGGAFFLATTQHLTAYYIGSKWIDGITYIVLILFLIIRPLGFSGNQLKKIQL